MPRGAGRRRGAFSLQRKDPLVPLHRKNISSGCAQKSIKFLDLRRTGDGRMANIMSGWAMGTRIENILKLRGLCVKIKFCEE